MDRLLPSLLCLLLACSAHAAADPTLESIARIVARDFHDPVVLKQRDWDARVAEARRDFEDARDASQRAAVYRALLASLRTSHTDYFAPGDPRHADLAAIFQRVLLDPKRCPDAATRPGYPQQVDEIGVWWERIDGAWFVAGVYDDGPAQKAGLLLGDEVLRADGAAFSPVAAFAGRSGRDVRLEVRRTRDGRIERHTVVPRTSEPLAMYAAATRASARVIERDGRRIGYVRFWSGVGESPAEVRNAIRELNGRGIDAFILDIRDGWGGVPPDFVSVFDRRVPVLVSRTREGGEFRFDGQLRVPTIVIVNERVRSGKELLALVIRKHRLATLLGTATPGALVSGTAYCLPDGGLMYLAVGTSTLDGEPLVDGKGVAPDVVVPFDVRHAAGVDAQLEAAVTRAAQRKPGR